ncbi:unnamed protein product [Darwinula stevensoni]|uniref:Uncharacterized protein n=1 Tax=Darwinula stevensoni TaxID=69355 RepID=A0A7R8WYD3_9CRUS|nr:unnamed protein product [Darwinula stevensoni]CAG0879201.1 unnamed protein product [Darwinula stevensoni]
MRVFETFCDCEEGVKRMGLEGNGSFVLLVGSCVISYRPDVVVQDGNSRRVIREVALKDRSNCTDGTSWPPNRVNTTQRLADLRSKISGRYDAFFIPTADPHLAEYGPECHDRRSWISGFDGSAGTAIVTTKKAALWTDGRYFLQADQQLDCNWLLMKSGMEGVPTKEEWLKSELVAGDKLAADPKLMAADEWMTLSKTLSEEDILLESEEKNPIDEIWSDRPKCSSDPIYAHKIEFAGKSWQEKVADLRKTLEEKKVDAIVVTAMDEVAWLYNLRGYDIKNNPVFAGFAIVDKQTAYLFVSEDRWTEEIYLHFNLLPGTSQCSRSSDCVYLQKYEEFLGTLERLQGGWEKVFIPSKYSYSGGASYAVHQLIEEGKIVQEPSPVLFTKARKNPTEVQGMINSHRRDSVALIGFLAMLEKEVKQGKPWDEMKAARELEKYRRAETNNMGLSFGSISAFGPNGAVIHYSPANETNRAIDDSSLYLLDSGGQYLDGTTDVTRTMHYGSPTPFQKEAYTRVLMGAIDLARTVFPKGTTDVAVDLAARGPLFSAGLNYRHGTGHGIGMFLHVHEEPGYYEDGQFGIRLETIVRVVKKNLTHDFDGPYYGFEPITLVPFEPNLIDVNIMSEEQLNWLDEYHARVRREIGGELLKRRNGHAYSWLMIKTQPLSKNQNVFGRGATNIPSILLLLFLSSIEIHRWL